ncbi:MAG: hypothetical protein AB7O66_21065 [Limisphaerales bacterium]
MTTRTHAPAHTLALAFTVVAGLGLNALLLGAPARAADADTLHLQAQLIWGTDSDKPADSTLKPIPQDLDKRLRRIFKWRNYFEVSQTNFVVASTQPARVDMSRECRVEVARQSSGEVEIQLFGRGKLVVRKRQHIVPGETVVIAGDDKDYNAWFVVLNPQKPR